MDVREGIHFRAPSFEHRVPSAGHRALSADISELQGLTGLSVFPSADKFSMEHEDIFQLQGSDVEKCWVQTKVVLSDSHLGAEMPWVFSGTDFEVRVSTQIAMEVGNNAKFENIYFSVFLKNKPIRVEYRDF